MAEQPLSTTAPIQAEKKRKIAETNYSTHEHRLRQLFDNETVAFALAAQRYNQLATILRTEPQWPESESLAGLMFRDPERRETLLDPLWEELKSKFVFLIYKLTDWWGSDAEGKYKKLVWEDGRKVALELLARHIKATPQIQTAFLALSTVRVLDEEVGAGLAYKAGERMFTEIDKDSFVRQKFRDFDFVCEENGECFQECLDNYQALSPTFWWDADA